MNWNPEYIEKLAEELFEYVCDHTPDANGEPWPHNDFSTLKESAKEHYRHAVRWHQITVNHGRGTPIDAWKYPKEFRYLVVASPMTDIPDFTKIIHSYCRMANTIKVPYVYKS